MGFTSQVALRAGEEADSAQHGRPRIAQGYLERAMVPQGKVNEVRRLLADGRLSQRGIARLTGVSRGTVGAIASGRRPDYPRERPNGDQWPDVWGPLERCPACGSRVYMPCRACAARSLKVSRPRQGSLASERSEPELRLELKEEHRRRYEQVRVRRWAAERREAIG